MDSFSWPVPNGKYVVKLHFAETFDGITGPGQRVFSFNVQGQEFKDFDVWVKAGGPLRAYVETVPAEITDGKLKVTFTPKVENPQINAIEIIPQGAAETSESVPKQQAATAPVQPAPDKSEVMAPAKPLQLPIAKGPFVGPMASLTNYTYPEWFRDAKFGIWAHWGPQAVPMEGDWYARKMYQQGSPDYNDHLKRWGHPSTNGWKDIVPLWKAENWNPEKLIELYKKAGARYFVSMGTHHDNFFLWNSKLHRWNSVQVGPHRDVVGEWQKAARKNGLHFGVSEHLGASFTWFQDAHKSDKTGPLAGVPYDGANSNYWDLYHFTADPSDRGWYSKNPKWQQEWFNEIEELVDNYKPDLLYTDGGVAFENEVGLGQIANLYNVNAAMHRGKSQAVYTCKQPSNGRWVQDYERGVNGGISPYPWQTDTSIGDWFYNRHWKYQPLSWTVHMLVDIVSKNGNLLLNVVLRPDGSLDPEVETMLHQLADWTAVNGEAIYGTRPWLVYGEGAVRAKGGAFRENMAYDAKDIRFTVKGKTLYAVALGWPDNGRMVIKSLVKTADPAQNRIKKIELLGHSGTLKFDQTADGLAVFLPTQRLSEVTCSLRITGSNLQPASSPETP
jgi:alpha-L-fucosidase